MIQSIQGEIEIIGDQNIFFFFQNIDYTHRQEGLLKVVIFVEL
jgi:hypothetical protein